jgi:hypothetical protein
MKKDFQLYKHQLQAPRVGRMLRSATPGFKNRQPDQQALRKLYQNDCVEFQVPTSSLEIQQNQYKQHQGGMDQTYMPAASVFEGLQIQTASNNDSWFSNMPPTSMYTPGNTWMYPMPANYGGFNQAYQGLLTCVPPQSPHVWARPGHTSCFTPINSEQLTAWTMSNLKMK